jgi:AraC family transcriptional regulator
LNDTSLMKFGEVCCAQKDGGPPAILTAVGPPGESGVSLLRMQFQRGAHFSATTRQHLISFQMSPHLRLECRMAGRRLHHETNAGALAICPAGIDCSAETDTSVDMLLIAIKPGQLALAAAEDSAIEAQLNERLSGYDQQLLGFARILAMESKKAYPNGPLYWNEVASHLISRLIFGHTSIPELSRGTLGNRTLERIRDHVMAHLAEPIEVAALAKLANRSPFHFSRVFARSVGMTPHRYVVHLRLQAAIEHVRSGRASLAEIAADTGFSDQSHLSRWVRRVHGVALSQFGT